MNADIATFRQLEETLLNLAKLMVDDEEAVTIEAVMQPNATMFRLHVAPEDVGKLIGLSGRTARAFRVILGTVSKKYGHPVSVDIVQNQ